MAVLVVVLLQNARTGYDAFVRVFGLVHTLAGFSLELSGSTGIISIGEFVYHHALEDVGSGDE